MQSGRTFRTSELLSRAKSCRRRVFSVSEDKTIIKCVASPKFSNNWDSVAKLLPWRTSRQCRDRWTYYLSPSNNLEPFSPEEDQIIVQKVNELGTKWAVISKLMPGRSDNSIKNRWYSKIKSMCHTNEDGSFSLIQRQPIDAPPARTSTVASCVAPSSNQLLGVIDHLENAEHSSPNIENQIIIEPVLIDCNRSSSCNSVNGSNSSSGCESEADFDLENIQQHTKEFNESFDQWDGEVIDWPIDLFFIPVETTFGNFF